MKYARVPIAHTGATPMPSAAGRVRRPRRNVTIRRKQTSTEPVATPTKAAGRTAISEKTRPARGAMSPAMTTPRGATMRSGHLMIPTNNAWQLTASKTGL